MPVVDYALARCGKFNFLNISWRRGSDRRQSSSRNRKRLQRLRKGRVNVEQPCPIEIAREEETSAVSPAPGAGSEGLQQRFARFRAPRPWRVPKDRDATPNTRFATSKSKIVKSKSDHLPSAQGASPDSARSGKSRSSEQRQKRETENTNEQSHREPGSCTEAGNGHPPQGRRLSLSG